MKKTLGRFFVSSGLLWGVFLLGLPGQAHAQGGAYLLLSSDTGNGPARQTYPEVIHVNNIGSVEATGVTLTFTAPKGAKVDSSCQVDHSAGGVRTYTCSLGAIPGNSSVDVTFLFSMNKAADAVIPVDVTCDQGSTDHADLSISIG